MTETQVLCELTLAEGLELGYALVARVADDVGARALAIKGRVNEAHGLREPRASADVDVLVEPARRDRLVDALLAAGWREIPMSPVPAPFGSHSVTLHHPQWPCELDVHDRFPGFFADPSAVFDALWTERTLLTAAGRAVPATGIHGTALVMALHALRTPNEPRNRRELAGLIERLSTGALDLERLRHLAEATGCRETARPLLTACGIDSSAGGADDTRLTQWQLRQAVGPMGSLRWLLAFRRTPVWRWPSLTSAMLLSTEPKLRRAYPQAPAGARGLWLARWWRLRRGVRGLPRAVHAARHIR